MRGLIGVMSHILDLQGDIQRMEDLQSVENDKGFLSFVSIFEVF